VDSAYRQLVEQVDRLAARLASRYARHLACRAGCSGCCHHHLSVFPVEADAVRDAVDALPPEIRAVVERQAREVTNREADDQPVACPLLVEHRCSIYEARPLICRTQGLPLLIQIEGGDGEAEVDFCPLNFTAPEATDDLDEGHLVPLDELNLKLALVNLQHCRGRGIADEESLERQKMGEIILQPRIPNLSSQISHSKSEI
jgi:Fe-S-cluster containining protein